MTGIAHHEADLLHCPKRKKLRSPQYVPLPEAARFLAQPKEPFESARLHPRRCLAYASGMEIKGGANADHHDAWKAALMLRHPEFLLWRTDADKEQIGPGPLNHSADIFVFCFGQRAKRW